MRPHKYRQEYIRHVHNVNWVRLYSRFTLPANSLSFVKVHTDERPKKSYSILSLFDGFRTNFPDCDADVYMPSLSFNADESVGDDGLGYSELKIPVVNQTGKDIDLWPGFILGECVDHRTDVSHYGVDCIQIGDLMREIEERVENRRPNCACIWIMQCIRCVFN